MVRWRLDAASGAEEKVEIYMWGKVAIAVPGTMTLFTMLACEGEYRPYSAVGQASPADARGGAGGSGAAAVSCPSEVDGSCPAAAASSPQRGSACTTDSDCAGSFPSCVSSRCACELTTTELAADPKNCGACGNDCSALAADASCEQGRCTRPGEPGPNDLAQSASGNTASAAIVAGGANLSSSRYSLQLSTAQSPGGNGVLRSPRYQLVTGVVGASR
jgi:hypothetical protein